MLILYADNDPDDVDLFQEAIASINPAIKCLSVNDGQQVIPFLEQMNTLPDFVFLDVNMPLMDGKQCMRELKKHKHFSKIPVVLYTTTCTNELVAFGEKLGAHRCLEKPVTFDKTVNLLRSVLSN